MHLFFLLEPNILLNHLAVQADRIYAATPRPEMIAPIRLLLAVRAMQHFAHASGAKLVAEGVENEADLLVVREIGIGFGQCYFFARPNAQPASVVADDARQAIRTGHIAVLPKATRPLNASPIGALASTKILVHAPYVDT
jgi:EAL domain